MSEDDGEGRRVIRLWAGTGLRVLFCAGLLWVLTAGSYALPVNIASATGLATLLCVLLCYELEIRGVHPAWIMGGMMAILAAVLGGYGMWEVVRPPAPEGALLAAGEPSPPTLCPQKAGPDDLVMLFGNNRTVGRGAGPFMPFTVDECPGFRLRRTQDGLVVETYGYTWSNDAAFMVRGNDYTPLEALQLRTYRPDRSTFVLLDRFDQEVVYVRYLNRNTARIRGRLICGEAPQALIRDEAVFMGGVRIGGAYMGLKRMKGRHCGEIESGNRYGLAIGKPPPW
jgi:hypothetical protein